jgi:hypothetical protein
VSTHLETGPPALQGWAQLGAAVALLAAAFAADPAGRALAVPAAVLLGVLGGRDLLLRPTLTADPDGIAVVDGFRRRWVGWDELEQARVVTDRRAPLLELDLGDTVVVLSRRRLGQPPTLVLEQLGGARPRQSDP